MKTTRTFKVSGLLVFVGTLLAAVPTHGVRALGIVVCVFAVPVFAISATRHLLRGLLWRVGSRLFVSYLLLLAPVLFVLLFGAAGIFLVAGQFAARRTQSAFERREAALSALARDLASRFELTRDATRRRALFEELRTADLPDLGYLYAVPGTGQEAGGDPAAGDLAPPTWTVPSAIFLARSKGRIFAVAAEQRRNSSLFVTLPLGPPLRRLLEKETGADIGFHGVVLTNVSGKAEGGGKGPVLTIDTGTKKTRVTSDPEARGLEAGETATRGRWITFPLFLQPILDWETGKPLEGHPLLILTRSSLETESRALFGSFTFGRRSQTLETHRIVLGLMTALAILTVVAYVLASLVSGLLVSRIARATHRLSLGFAEIEKGNFAHRILFKGQDQLAALVGSFNHMVERLSASVAARAEKEALERELSVARDLQRRLLPPADFACPGVGIAVDFAPAAAIGGDFYDLSYAERVLTVAVADVSGHGLPTGLVMAAAKASLGMLARTGAGGVRLMELLHEEIVRTTERRTFVTLAHLVFDLAKGSVAYTNAGHPYPYRVCKDGTVEALVNPARPLGLALSGGWHTVTAPLVPGDCWVLFSDGLVEATRAGSDESWGFARLEEALRAGQAESAAALKDRILEAQRTFTARADTEDDRTLLVLRIDGAFTAGA
jgi:serine phosphatase RsbU (regulator of sigma subunit)